MTLDDVIAKMEENVNDYSMPRRVKVTLARVKEDLKKDEQDIAVRVTSAIYELEDIVNDVNISMHAKTALWDIISDLEALKED